MTKIALSKIWNLKLHRKIEVLLTESRAMSECLLQNGFPPAQITRLPNFTEIPGSWDEVSAFNHRMHRPDERAVLFVGRASREKGLDFLIEAMALVAKPWKLILVTGGDRLPRIRRKIEALGIKDSVEIQGVLDYQKTRACHARSDVVAIPSVWIEPFCLVGLEAMANAKPVVAFDAGGIPDWLDHEKTGFLVPVKDVKMLAEKIERLLTDPLLAHRMGQNGYEKVCRQFNRDLYCGRLLDIYETAVRKRMDHGSRTKNGQRRPVVMDPKLV